MGLLTGLLTLPLAPMRGTIALAEQVQKQAEEQYYDPAAIRQELEEVDELRAQGLIEQDEATEREDRLVQRLLEGRAERQHTRR